MCVSCDEKQNSTSLPLAKASSFDLVLSLILAKFT